MKSPFWLLRCLIPVLAALTALPLFAGCFPNPNVDPQKVNFGGPNSASSNDSVATEPAPATTAGVTVESVPATSVPGDSSSGKVVRPGRLWVVVRNLQLKSYGKDTDITADWEIVQGSPEPGTKYVLRVSDGDSGGQVERYVDFDVYLDQGSGTVSDGVRGGEFAERGLYAIMGKKSEVQGDIGPVSGKAPVGGESQSTPPPTAAATSAFASAGIAADGMLIALANPRREARRLGAPRGGWSVDYQLQNHFSAGDRYNWVIEDAEGNRVLIDVTNDLVLPTRPKIGTFSGTPVGASRTSGQIKMYIERKGPAGGGQSSGEIVSNTVTLE